MEISPWIPRSVGARARMSQSDSAKKTKPGTRPGFATLGTDTRDYWVFSSVRRLVSLLHAGNASPSASSGRLSP